MLPEHLHTLDKVARLAAALLYSGGQQQATQGYIAANTVAAVRVKNTLYLAYNTIFATNIRNQQQVPREKQRALQGGLRSLVQSELRDPKLQVVFLRNNAGPFDRNYHAEMQLIDFRYHKRLQPAQDRIGVNKPCCQRCALALDRLGIHYAHWHDVDVGNKWRAPQASKRWWSTKAPLPSLNW